MKKETILQTAENLGFSHAGFLAASDLRFMEEVRDMCAADRCHMYGRSWMCPPACGTLEENASKASAFQLCLLVQTTAVLEDAFDIETMTRAEAEHKARFAELCGALRHETACLPLGSGACTLCKDCAYPDAPCRFPEKAIPSMESFGLLVTSVCQAAGMKYYYGPGTLTYTSCVLLP